MLLIKKKFYIIFFYLILVSFSNAEEIFLSLKKNKVNVRYGPGFDFPIKYVYKKINLPIKQIDKKENFQLKPANSLIATQDKVLFSKPSIFSKPLANIKEGRLLVVQKCERNWCKIETESFKGWVNKENLWGFIN
jgi:SH3-like domain-containing protein